MISTLEQTGGADPYVVNGKRYSLWPQFVEKKAEWIGGTLWDGGDPGYGCPSGETPIVNIEFTANGKDSAFFQVEGKEWVSGSDVRYLSVDPELSKRLGDELGGIWLGFSGYGGHSWAIRKP